MQNLTKCPRCNKHLIAEEFNEHECNTPFLGIIELGIRFWYEVERDTNDDRVFMVKGIDGILYRLIQCEHNPPHPDVYPRSYKKTDESLHDKDPTETGQNRS